MSAIPPLQTARVSNLLRSDYGRLSLARTQQDLLRAQNELATQRRLNTPSDSPGDAGIAQQIRKTLERRDAYKANISKATSQLSAVDSSLDELTNLLREAQTVASANVGADSTPEQRKSAAAVVQAIYNQALSLANQQFEGVYLFAGDKGGAPPYTEETGGVRFVGSFTPLKTAFDDRGPVAFGVDPSRIFGTLSDRVEGTVDLTPNLTGATRLDDLRGAGGTGIARETFTLGNGTTSAVIDLSDADNVQDVVDRINAAAVGGITASITGLGLTLTAGPGDNLTVIDNGGTTAADLGIARPIGSGAGVGLVGPSVSPRVSEFTPLSALSGGTGLVTTGGLKISAGDRVTVVDFTGDVTVGDLLNSINGSRAGGLAVINDAGTGIDILNPHQGVPLRIAENAGGTLAAQLGVRSFDTTSQLTDLNGGAGVVLSNTGADLQITLRDGSQFQVELSAAVTVNDVLTAINTSLGASGTASFATDGNGIVITDATGGPGSITIESLNFSKAAEGLGLKGTTTAASFQGTDVHPIENSGLFANLAKLQRALENSDTSAITASAEGLQADLDRAITVRGEVGAQIKELDGRLDRLEDQNIASQALLSELEDVDYTEAVTRFQLLQTTLEANLKTLGTILDLSLLDFLG